MSYFHLLDTTWCTQWVFLSLSLQEHLWDHLAEKMAVSAGCHTHNVNNPEGGRLLHKTSELSGSAQTPVRLWPNCLLLFFWVKYFSRFVPQAKKGFCGAVPPAIHWENLFLNCFHEVCLVWDQTLQAEGGFCCIYVQYSASVCAPEKVQCWTLSLHTSFLNC